MLHPTVTRFSQAVVDPLDQYFIAHDTHLQEQDRWCVAKPSTWLQSLPLIANDVLSHTASGHMALLINNKRTYAA